jgi:hypothetical protein
MKRPRLKITLVQAAGPIPPEHLARVRALVAKELQQQTESRP